MSCVVAPTWATVAGAASCGPRPSRGKGKGKQKVDVQETRPSCGGFSRQRKDPLWSCVQRCGACCKLDKGPAFATPEEIFEDTADVELYRSLIGPDGWCKHFQKTTRTCSIYSDRPYFCRVEPKVFQDLYGIGAKHFNKEACRSCRDTIKAIYGPCSIELDNFNKNVQR